MNAKVCIFSIIPNLIVFLCLNSCGPMRHINNIENTHDTIINNVYVRDTIVRVDTIVKVELPRESHASEKKAYRSSHLETSLAVSDAWIDTTENVLRHTLNNKDTCLLEPVRIYVPVERKSSDSVRVEIRTQTKTEFVEVNKLTTWQEVLIKVGKAALALLISGVIYIILRCRLK